jgi:hypothetical protein
MGRLQEARRRIRPCLQALQDEREAEKERERLQEGLKSKRKTLGVGIASE